MLKKLTALLLLLPALVFAESFVAGKDYQVLPTYAPAVSGVASLTEFFSYGCPWCYKLEAPLEKWLKGKGDKIHFQRLPVVFHKDWEFYAKAFYIAQTLGQSEKFNLLLFKAIQTDKKPLNSGVSMADFFISQGLDKNLVQSALEHSPAIDMQVQNGMAMMGKYQINAIPAFVVNGHYKTDLEKAKSPERLLQILDYLISLG